MTEIQSLIIEYAEKEMNCSQDEYDERWSSIIHYLVKFMRIFIKEQLEAT